MDWRSDEDDLLVSLRRQGLTFPEIAERLPGRSDSACRNRFRFLDRDGAGGEIVRGSPATALEEWREHRGKKPTWQEILAHAQRGAELQEGLRPHYTRASRKVVTDAGCIFVVNAADFHLGAPATDYDAFFRTTDLIIGDPRFYLTIVGRDLETAFAWFHSAEAVLNQVIPPWMQIEAFRQWLEEMLPRTLCICGDNHTDERLERVLGDIGLVWDSRVPYFRSYGLLALEVSDGKRVQTYEGLLTHRYKGRSIYHDLQPALRAMRDIYPVADFYVTAHTHRPAYMFGVFYPEARPETMPEQHFLVCGTFKTGHDLYAERRFGGSGVLGLPTLQVFSDRHEIIYYKSPEAALLATGGTK